MEDAVTALVVVGIDDVHRGAHALKLAGREAELRGVPLWIAHAYPRSPMARASVSGRSENVEGPIRDSGFEPLGQAVKLVRAEHPDLEIHDYVTEKPVHWGLTGLAGEDSLLVVGDRGRGGFTGMLLGSVALRILAHTICPVIVARGADRVVNRVVVGLDVADLDATGGAVLLGFAFQEAALRRAELVVLHVWEDLGYFYPEPYGEYTLDRLAALDEEHRRSLDANLEPWRGEHPEVRVHAVVEGGSPSRRLVNASEEADLVVIGGRRHRDGEETRMGGLALLHHAQCPVAVVPQG
jgi:nucleotide-binding universal stress UspA family protein